MWELGNYYATFHAVKRFKARVISSDDWEHYMVQLLNQSSRSMFRKIRDKSMRNSLRNTKRHGRMTPCGTVFILEGDIVVTCYKRDPRV